MTITEYEYDARRQRRQRVRLRQARRSAHRWKVAALIFAILFILSILAPLAFGKEEPAAAPPAEESTGPVIAVLPIPGENIPAAEPVPITEPEPDYRYSLVIENATVTHYCICQECCGKEPSHPDYGITASGRPAEPGYSIAVDPFMIELGSIVHVDYGDGILHEYRADDTGSGVTGAHIDLCATTHAEANQLGVKTATVYVLEI